jgi:tRNA(Ile2) C34 agmatinyltransferase TiaS
MSNNPICSVCKRQTETAETQGEFVCPDCGRIYVPGYEIVEYPDELEPIGSEDQPELAGLGGASSPLVAADDEIDPSMTDMLYKSAKHKPNQGELAESWD